MNLRVIALAGGLLLAVGAVAYTAPFPTLSSDVGVCDPNNPLNCLAPSSGGGLPVSPTGTTPASPGQYTPVSDSSAQSLTIPTGATYAVVCVENTSHRFTWDGTTTPTASVGSLVSANSCTPFSGAAALAAFKIIAVSAGGTFTASFGK